MKIYNKKKLLDHIWCNLKKVLIWKIREECIMEKVYSQIDVNAYVAKYMDETGCNLNEACEELGIDPSRVFSAFSEEDDMI